MKKTILIAGLVSVLTPSLFALCYQFRTRNCGGTIALSEPCRGFGGPVSCTAGSTMTWNDAEALCGDVVGYTAPTITTNDCIYSCVGVGTCTDVTRVLRHVQNVRDMTPGGDWCEENNRCIRNEQGTLQLP